MKFDTIIIGGGLTGLVSGLWLQQQGKRTCIVSFGQTLLHFFSGSLSGVNPDGEVATLLADAGVKTTAGGYRLTPLGELRPAAFTLEGYYHSADAVIKEQSVAIVRLPKYLGLPIEFLVDSLAAQGKTVSVIAPEAVATTKADVILVPACKAGNDLKQQYGARVTLVAAMPPSIPGQNFHAQLVKRYQQLGGTFIQGDKVVKSTLEGGRVAYVETEKLTDERLVADNFILAAGSFQSEGLQSNYDHVWEPVFGVDVDAPADRTQWTDLDFFADQPYQHYGVCRDAQGHALIDGAPIGNLYPAGHILGGARTEIENLNEALEVCRKLV